jgi:hypothetical protein
MLDTVEQHFEGKSPHVREIYDKVLAACGEFGYFAEDPKKTSIHLNRNSAFAGVKTQVNSLVLTVKATEDIASDRVGNSQQASARRWYCYIKVSSPEEVDEELVTWLKNSYDLSA